MQLLASRVNVKGETEKFFSFQPSFFPTFYSTMCHSSWVQLNTSLSMSAWKYAPLSAFLGSVFSLCDDCFSICLLVWPFRKTIHSLELDSRFKEPKIFESSPIYCIFAMYIVEERQRISAQYNCLPLQWASIVDHVELIWLKNAFLEKRGPI